MQGPKNAKRLVLSLAAAVAAGICFYPGFMSADSIDQYLMAETSVYRDWHPPIMTWTWSVISTVIPGPAGMLTFHLALLWAALYQWWTCYKERSQAWLFCVIPFLPWVWNFVGVLWKDVGMAFSLLLLSSFLPLPPSRLRACLAFGVAAYAINVRHNAVFAVAPIIAFLIFSWYSQLQTLAKVLLSLSAIASLLFLGNALNYGLLAAEKTQPSNTVMLDYLVHLSAKHNRSYIPGFNISEINLCATGATRSELPASQYRLTGQIYCLARFETYKKPPPLRTVAWGDYSGIWRALVVAYPVDYLSFRLFVFRRFMGLTADPPRNIWFSGVVENDLGIRHPPNPFSVLPEICVNAAARSIPVVFRPYLYLLLSVGVLAISSLLNSTPTRYAARALATSSVIYILGYLVIAPSFDFRFIYWSVIATTVTLLLLIVNWPGLKSAARD